MKSETLSETEDNLIFIEKDTPCSRAAVDQKIASLNRAVVEAEARLNCAGIRTAMRTAVPTYRDPDEINKRFEDSEEKKLSEYREPVVAVSNASDKQ